MQQVSHPWNGIDKWFPRVYGGFKQIELCLISVECSAFTFADIKRTDMASFSPSVPASNDKLPLMRKEDPDRVDQTSSMAPSLHGKRASPAEDLSSCDTLITSGSDAGIAMSDASSSVSGSTENGESSIRSGNAKMLCRPPKPLASSALIHFFSGNPAVETTEGILHLYKEEWVAYQSCFILCLLIKMRDSQGRKLAIVFLRCLSISDILRQRLSTVWDSWIPW